MALTAGQAPHLLTERLPQLRATLETYRESALREIAGRKRELARSAASEAGIAHGAAAHLYDRELLITELTMFRRGLYEIEAALGRLRAGVYGMCVDCGRPIPLDRLDARPQVARDADCARHTELEFGL